MRKRWTYQINFTDLLIIGAVYVLKLHLVVICFVSLLSLIWYIPIFLQAVLSTKKLTLSYGCGCGWQLKLIFFLVSWWLLYFNFQTCRLTLWYSYFQYLMTRGEWSLRRSLLSHFKCLKFENICSFRFELFSIWSLDFWTEWILSKVRA